MWYLSIYYLKVLTEDSLATLQSLSGYCCGELVIISYSENHTELINTLQGEMCISLMLKQVVHTEWGKVTSLNFKVNNKKTIRGIKILFLDSETTTWEVLNHIVLKRISCKWWPLLSIHCYRRFLIFRITLSSISCGMRATSRRIASFSACRVLGRCLNTSAFRYANKK